MAVAFFALTFADAQTAKSGPVFLSGGTEVELIGPGRQAQAGRPKTREPEALRLSRRPTELYSLTIMRAAGVDWGRESAGIPE